MELLNHSGLILKKLTRTYREAPLLASDQQKIVVFSDHHRGDRGPSDYFKQSEKTYNSALGYYLERGYTLILLGDVEEFWENSPRKVFQSYPLTYKLEREFHDRGRFIKIHGNHDNLWKNQNAIDKYLSGIFPGIKIHDACRIERRNEKGELLSEIFLTHGHQGTFLSDTLDWFGMFWLRLISKAVLKPFKQKYQTPATSYSLREEHETVMFRWAEQMNQSATTPLLFIAGHTHHPIFMSSFMVKRILSNIQQLKRSGSKKHMKLAALLRGKLEYIQADVGIHQHLIESPSYYYNTGSCSFFDGSITGIEISKNKIKLIKWMDLSNRAERMILGTERFRDIKREDPDFVPEEMEPEVPAHREPVAP